MTHGSLFSGIGGFDLAAQWAGWDNVFQCEIDLWCQKVLTKNFPNVKRYGDIKQFDGSELRGKVDVISGGFPCQPYSTAGKRLGKEDERHLWPEMLRIIQDASPTWVVGENVRGLVSWSDGLVFEEVCADLEAAGYEVQPFILPAASVGAPHIRQRIWFIAHSYGCGGEESAILKSGLFTKPSWNNKNATIAQEKRRSGFQFGAEPKHSIFGGTCEHGIIANTECLQGVERYGATTKRRRQKETEQIRMGGIIDSNPNNERREEQHVTGEPSRPGRLGGYDATQWDEWTTESPVCGVDDGIPLRMDRIAGLGNAVVPHVVFQIFDAINQYEAL